ncbi:thiamine pyrophosphate-binding protein [Pseudonocardia bannensis]|uniref:Thiamine pyrophosphate-binding protein n=1 Tax=Pseudonocardia bannensis TaxID=630973 RepID=A0A848DGP3_9PSEU|nr:thiamine pyrophosphate-dependent enzyme [Pseudonocardia bannensis]NMH91691.1 thiamine pyrophosphate-binding protein [Pseudonocardia bannensis]
MSAGSHTFTSVAAGLADGLHGAGVRRLFGMPGGGPNLEMIGAAAERGIGFTLAHGETAACVMAGAFGLLTGTPGTALVTRGPGLTSAVNGLAQAFLDRSPLLLLSDCVPAVQRDRIAHQRLDQLAVAAPVTRWNGTLGHRDPAATVAAAAALAAGPPAGAVHLDYDASVPGDLPPAVVPPAAPDAAALERAIAVAGGRRRPVVVLGVDAVAHAPALREVLTGGGVPVLTTYQAAGVVDSGSPESAGLFTNAALERPLLDRADLIVGVGLDPVEPLPAPWSYDAPTLLLTPAEVDPAYFGSPTVVDGPPAPALAAVLGACIPDWPAGAGQRHRRARLADLAADARDGAGLHPIDLVRAVHEIAGHAQLTVDAGAHMLAAMPFWPATRPHGILISNGLATMGYALPAAIGAALARRGERVVCLVGDGGLGMSLAELETLARIALPVTVVVFDDAALSLIELKQRAGQGGADAVRFDPVDFAGVAAAMGVPSAVADDVAGVRAALSAPSAAGPGPFLLDARIGPAGYRHIIDVSRG